MRKACQLKGIRFTDRDMEIIRSSRDIDIVKKNYESLIGSFIRMSRQLILIMAVVFVVYFEISKGWILSNMNTPEVLCIP